MVRWTEATQEAFLPDEPAEEPEAPRRRLGGRRLTTVLVLLALGFLAFAALRFAGVESTTFLAAAMAATPYAVVAGFGLGLVTLLLGRKLVAVTVLLVAVAVATFLAPRYFAEEQPSAGGAHLRVMAANLHLGTADAKAVVELVRSQRVDVLALPELTPAAVERLDDAGLADVLPYRVFDERVGGDGSGIAARVPLRQIVLVEESSLSQPSAVVDLPGRRDIEVMAVHVLPPTESVSTWHAELRDLPEVAQHGRVRVLAGDFNATLDHGAFRAVLDRGYADAAEETGNGLEPTWSDLPFGPPLTIDHIVADARCAVSGYAVHDLPGSDHDAVIAELVLP